jgi:enamine deaminase RidA (YjgF/YER057c/UK114 family)
MSDEPSIEFVRPAGLYRDAPYAYAAVAPSGRLVFSAGACPVDAAGVVVGPGDLEAQARQTVANLFVALEAAGASPGAVLKTTVYVVSSSQEDLVRVWAVVKSAFEPSDPPSTLLGVSALGYSGQLVEIEAVALVPAPSEPAPSP